MDGFAAAGAQCSVFVLRWVVGVWRWNWVDLILLVVVDSVLFKERGERGGDVNGWI